MEMKRIKMLSIVLLASLFFASCSDKKKQTKEKEKTSLELLDLRGKVQSLKTTTYYADSEVLKDSIILENKRKIFNELGQMIEEQNCRSNGSVFAKECFVFDKENRLIDEKKYDDKGRLTYSHQNKYTDDDFLTGRLSVRYKYSSEGDVEIDTLINAPLPKMKRNADNQIIELQANFKGKVQKTILEYDDRGNKVKGSVFFADSLLGELKFKYNADDQMIERFFVKQDTIVFKALLEYNKEGKIISNRDYYKDKLTQESLTKYYTNGNVKERSHYTDFGDSKSIEKFNQQGKMIEDLRYTADSLTYRELMEYNNEGDLICSRRYNAKGEMPNRKRIYKYEYDEHHNWIKRIFYEKGRVSDITLREIEYFD